MIYKLVISIAGAFALLLLAAWFVTPNLNTYAIGGLVLVFSSACVLATILYYQNRQTMQTYARRALNGYDLLGQPWEEQRKLVENFMYHLALRCAGAERDLQEHALRYPFPRSEIETTLFKRGLKARQIPHIFFHREFQIYSQALRERGIWKENEMAPSEYLEKFYLPSVEA